MWDDSTGWGGYIKRATPIHRSVVQRSAHAGVIFLIFGWLDFDFVLLFLFVCGDLLDSERGEKKRNGAQHLLCCEEIRFRLRARNLNLVVWYMESPYCFPDNDDAGVDPTHPHISRDQAHTMIAIQTNCVRFSFSFKSFFFLFLPSGFSYWDPLYLYIYVSPYNTSLHIPAWWLFFFLLPDGKTDANVKSSRDFFSFLFSRAASNQKNSKRTRNSRHVNIFLLFFAPSMVKEDQRSIPDWEI
jgi:hypothetical protein